MNNVYTFNDTRYYADDDMEDKAWKAGYLHSYRGLDAGWLDGDTIEMYDLGKRDGAEDRRRTIERGEADPHDWDGITDA